MLSDHERRLARLAVERRYLTGSQLEASFSHRRAASDSSLDRILVEHGYLTEPELRELVRLSQGAPIRPPFFAEILRERGLATESQVEEALQVKFKLARQNVHRYVGEILVERRVITSDQVSQVLAQQGKVSLQCAACGYRFNALQGASYECPECGRALGAPGDGARVERYGPCTPREEIGRGPASVVHRARHARLGHDVALKVVRMDAIPREVRDKYLFQARRTMALVHPNLARTLDANLQGDLVWIARELVDGLPLHDHVLGSLRLPVEEAIATLKQTAAALGAAHGRGIVHGNLKAHNVLVTETREVKVTDFGLASIEDASLARVTAPERRRHAATPPSDLYGAGILWYFMLSGQWPFEGASPEAIRDLHHQARPEPLSRFVADLPPGAEAIFTKLTFREPSLRYRHAAALMEDLDRLENGRPTLAQKELDRSTS
jgi:hypothetical protein